MTEPAAAVVTGGGRGLGLAMARTLASTGLNIGLVDVLDDVASTAKAIEQEFGVAATGIQADVRDAAQVERAFAQLQDDTGLATVLVTAAGITSWCASVDVTPEDWQRVLDINLNGTFFACQSFARRLLVNNRRGSAILISSMSGRIVNVPQHQASYNSSKAAVSMLAKSLAVEWAPSGIRVNALEPGYTLSDMTRQFTEANPELTRQWVAAIPMGRMGEPEDLLGAVRFLASDDSAYVTGQSIVIDGGYTAI